MYGWEKFLTPRDVEHDKLWGKKEMFGFGSKPALLLIDLYYNVLGVKREPIFESMKTWPDSTGLEGWAAVDRISELLKVARESGVPVIHVKMGLDPNIVSWIRRPPVVFADAELARKGAEIVDEVAPVEGEVVIDKTAASAFWGTPLLMHLVGLGVDTLICCGETTSGCVRATVVDGATHRFRMGVVQECVFDRTEAAHYVNLYDMHQKYADVVPLDMAKKYLKTAGGAGSDPAE